MPIPFSPLAAPGEYENFVLATGCDGRRPTPEYRWKVGLAIANGLTYNGFPYLPNSNDLFNSFESGCLQKAQGAA